MKVRAGSIVNPRTVLFAIASLNLLWFLAQSRFIQEFGSTSITFCVVCPWYWDLNLTSPPVLSWFASILLLSRRVTRTAAAVLIAIYEILEGYSWVSAGNGFPASLFERIEIVKRLDSIAWWELLELQYLFAFLIFIAATIYLVAGIIRVISDPSPKATYV